MDTPAIGIDLGTTTSIVAVVRNGVPEALADPVSRHYLVPSVLALDARGHEVVGTPADRVSKPDRVIRESKRGLPEARSYPLGDRVVPAAKVAERILVKMIDVAEDQLGVRPVTAVVTVPAAFGDASRKATLEAARRAGLTDVRLMSEPVAAALAHGTLTADRKETLLVVDFGGGTLDVSVVERTPAEIGVLASFGDPALGGKDMDGAIVEWALARFRTEAGDRPITADARERLRRAAVEAKIDLSGAASTILETEFLSGDAGIHAELTRTEFERLIAPLLDRTAAVVREALGKARIEPTAVDRILLVGGATYVPAVRDRLEAALGRPLEATVNRDTAVALGAAIAAAAGREERPPVVAPPAQQAPIDPAPAETAPKEPAPSGPASIDAPRVRDVATFGVGVLVMKTVNGQRRRAYDELIAPNSPIPYEIAKEYALSTPRQDSIELEVVQDPTGRAILPDDVLRSETVARMSGIPVSLTGIPHTVRVGFRYDRDHRIHLTATVVETNQSVEVRLGE